MKKDAKKDTQCTFKVLRGEGSGIAGEFLRAWKENFGQSTPVWLLMLTLGIFLHFELDITAYMSSWIQDISRMALTIAGILWAAESIYIYPLTAFFENTRKNSMKNALLIAVGNLPQTVLLLGIWLLPFLLVLVFPASVGYLILAFLLIWAEANVMISSMVLSKIFGAVSMKETQVLK
ncbi:DUF624 domain-containing protein [Muricomes intestini]|mgnify:FL=1|uniref:DUF624 domain-containing protein n=1 Tax=Muricomes intestini TaxID=1796634 RepID=UPI002FDF7F52